MVKPEHLVLMDLLRSRINRNPRAFGLNIAQGIRTDSEILETALLLALRQVRQIEGTEKV